MFRVRDKAGRNEPRALGYMIMKINVFLGFRDLVHSNEHLLVKWHSLIIASKVGFMSGNTTGQATLQRNDPSRGGIGLVGFQVDNDK